MVVILYFTKKNLSVRISSRTILCRHFMLLKMSMHCTLLAYISLITTEYIVSFFFISVLERLVIGFSEKIQTEKSSLGFDRRETKISFARSTYFTG